MTCAFLSWVLFLTLGRSELQILISAPVQVARRLPVGDQPSERMFGGIGEGRVLRDSENSMGVSGLKKVGKSFFFSVRERSTGAIVEVLSISSRP